MVITCSSVWRADKCAIVFAVCMAHHLCRSMLQMRTWLHVHFCRSSNSLPLYAAKQAQTHQQAQHWARSSPASSLLLSFERRYYQMSGQATQGLGLTDEGLS